MPKVKIARKSISLDMTAMCDMAFLLLTFFMLATKFQPSEAVVVDMPSSHSQIRLPDVDIMTITVRTDGAVFFGVDGQFNRERILEDIAAKYKITFSDKQKKEFSLTPNFGVPVSQLQALFNLSNDDRTKAKQIGIPADSLKNELGDWIYAGRKANRNIRIAVKGDKDSNYEVIKNVIATLQDQNVNKFNLITTLEQ
jgi:biopolymer transport protein ExbD